MSEPAHRRTILLRRAICIALTLSVVSDRAAVAQLGMLFASHEVRINEDVIQPHVIGDRVFFVLEAETHPFRLPDSPDTVENVRGYICSARLLGDNRAVRASREIVGPLYDIKKPFSTIANQAGVTFGAADRNALDEKPDLGLGIDGEIRRLVPSQNGSRLSIWKLQVRRKSAAWVKIADRPALKLLGPLSGTYFESFSHQFAVQLEKDGKAHVYDLRRGESRKDEWLENVARQIWSRDGLRNEQVILLDDLNAVVVLPRGAVAIRSDDDIDGISTATEGGRTTAKQGSFLVFRRPNPHPQFYKGKLWGAMAALVGNDLLFLFTDTKRAWIQDVAGRIRYSRVLTEKYKWIGQLPCEEFAGQMRRVVFISRPFNVMEKSESADLQVAVWDFEQDRFSEHSVPLADIFKMRPDGYRAVGAIPVER